MKSTVLRASPPDPPQQHSFKNILLSFVLNILDSKYLRDIVKKKKKKVVQLIPFAMAFYLFFINLLNLNSI